MRQRAGARFHQPASDFAGIVRERDDVVADVLAAHAGRIGGADQRADRGAGDGVRLQSHLVERLDHRDVREAARAAAAERKREGFHGCLVPSQSSGANGGVFDHAAKFLARRLSAPPQPLPTRGGARLG